MVSNYQGPTTPSKLDRETDAIHGMYGLFWGSSGKGGASLLELILGTPSQEALLQSHSDVQEQLKTYDPTQYDNLIQPEKLALWAAISQAQGYVVNAIQILGAKRIQEEITQGKVSDEDQMYLTIASFYPFEEFKNAKPDVRKRFVDGLARAVDVAYEMLERLPKGSTQNS